MLFDAPAAEARRSGRGGPKKRITRSLSSLNPNKMNYTKKEKMRS